MYDVIAYVTSHWVEWLFLLVTALLSMSYRSIYKMLKEEQQKNDAIAKGVQSLLRESIVANYNKYQERECCPIYAKEAVKKVYEAYHNLGGNDVATELYEKILKMPEKKEDNDD